MAKKSLPGALEAKPEGEIWRTPFFATQRPRLPIRLRRILYGVYLAPLRLHRERILTLAGLRIFSPFAPQKLTFRVFFQL